MTTSRESRLDVRLQPDDGVGLAAVAGLPQTAAPRGTRWPAVVLTGPFTGVKEQVTGLYARRLTDAGFVTLALDHRGFGSSGGRRAHEDSQGKLADLRAAASDPRLKVVAGVAGGYNSPVATPNPSSGRRSMQLSST
jgi:uncharacterized protein